MIIYIVRHGETRSNVEGLLQGWSNDSLNDNGINLARITGKKMLGIKFDTCFSSPLARASQTAKIILHESKNDGIIIRYEDRIKEINMGKWERKRFRPPEQPVDEKELKLFFTDPFKFSGFPEGENVHQVCKRTQSFLKKLASRKDINNCLVVTHGFALRAMLNCLYEDPLDFWHGHVPYNCAVNIIESDDEEIKLIGDDIIYYSNDDIVDRYLL